MFLLVLLAYFLPGLVVGLAARLRSWTLVASAPALTFGLVAVGVPVLGRLQVPWNALTAASWTAAVALVTFVLTIILARRITRIDQKIDPRVAPTSEIRSKAEVYGWWQHALVAVGCGAGMAVGVVTFLRGTGGLNVINQDWDAPFHANAIRWIAEHHNALPSGLATIADSPGQTDYFYPDTYHALWALVLDHGGLGMPQLLNLAAMTTIIAWPIGIAAVGHTWGLPAPAVAVAAAVSTWFGTFPYDSLWRGPLWPFVAGVALVPAVLAIAREIVRPRPDAPLAGPVAGTLAVAGLVGLHTSLAFVLIIYFAMLLVALLVRLEAVEWRSVVLPIAGTAVFAVIVVGFVTLPALSSAGGVLAAQWPQLSNPAEAFTQAAMFSPPDPNLQWYLGIPALAGLAIMVKRRQMMWIIAAYAFFAALYMSGAAYMLPPMRALTGIFYTDVWRIAALLPLAGSIGLGVFADWLVRCVIDNVRLLQAAVWRRAVVTYAVLAGFLGILLLATSGAYMNRNAERLSYNYSDGPTVSHDEIAAYDWLATRVQPGERVANDLQDGSTWMYALAKVEPVKWTFNPLVQDTDAQYLLNNMNKIDVDPRIREVAARLDVRFVLFSAGTVRRDELRSPGMVNLAEARGLRPVMGNSDTTIYEILPRDPFGP
jgi:hypothetical protein